MSVNKQDVAQPPQIVKKLYQQPSFFFVPLMYTLAWLPVAAMVLYLKLTIMKDWRIPRCRTQSRFS